MPLGCRALHRALFVLVGALLAVAPSVAAQATATVRAEENFRREPSGVILGRLVPGTTLPVLSRDGNWTQVRLEGSVWLASLRASDDPAFDLVVSEAGGENLRSGPSGTILGRLEEGALLTEVSRGASWARVQRTGWIWSASLDQAPAASPAAAAAGGARPAPLTSSSTSAPAGPATRAPGGFVNVGSGGPILTSPDGDTLAHATADREVQIVRREGNWAQVRLEGWMWMPPAAGASAGGAAAATEPPAALEPGDLRQGAHTGRVVEWSVQFISLERAEAVRTDFFQGEPFLLARYSGGDGSFVYVAVPVDRLAEVEGLVPLERITVTGRVRTGASALTGAPILDMINIERGRERR